MSGLAELLLAQGFQVSGSDLQASASTERLAARGARIFVGHSAANIAGADVVVATSAVQPDNPEVEEARRRGLPVVRRGELLAEMMRGHYGIAIGGSHGKTTTTAMTAAILVEAGLDPTAVVGGRIDDWGGSNVRFGAGRYFVAESDESDGSFLWLSPVVAVVTNVDREHLDHYGEFENVQRAFVEFANKVPFYGVAVVCLEDANARALLPEMRGPVMTYGFREDSDMTISVLESQRGGTRFSLAWQGRSLGTFEVSLLGRHNVLNAAAAVLAAMHVGISEDVARRALAGFHGVNRRMQIIGSERGVTVADDYGHHPTEIRATLQAARQGGYGGIHVLFQPHRFTRTRSLMEQFQGCFGDADRVIILDVYAASEQPIEGVSGAALAERVRAAGHKGASYSHSVPAAIEEIVGSVGEGDLVITLGAGSVFKAGPEILALLRRDV